MRTRPVFVVLFYFFVFALPIISGKSSKADNLLKKRTNQKKAGEIGIEDVDVYFNKVHAATKKAVNAYGKGSAAFSAASELFQLFYNGKESEILVPMSNEQVACFGMAATLIDRLSQKKVQGHEFEEMKRMRNTLGTTFDKFMNEITQGFKRRVADDKESSAVFIPYYVLTRAFVTFVQNPDEHSKKELLTACANNYHNQITAGLFGSYKEGGFLRAQFQAYYFIPSDIVYLTSAILQIFHQTILIKAACFGLEAEGNITENALADRIKSFENNSVMKKMLVDIETMSNEAQTALLEYGEDNYWTNQFGMQNYFCALIHNERSFDGQIESSDENINRFIQIKDNVVSNYSSYGDMSYAFIATEFIGGLENRAFLVETDNPLGVLQYGIDETFGQMLWVSPIIENGWIVTRCHPHLEFYLFRANVGAEYDGHADSALQEIELKEKVKESIRNLYQGSVIENIGEDIRSELAAIQQKQNKRVCHFHLITVSGLLFSSNDDGFMQDNDFHGKDFNWIRMC